MPVKDWQSLAQLGVYRQHRIPLAWRGQSSLSEYRQQSRAGVSTEQLVVVNIGSIGKLCQPAARNGYRSSSSQ